jgi:radical SAM superfamily enzyme YgiQ (UPF0313 family)
VSSRVSDHPEIIDIVNALGADGYEVSVSSLRVATTSRELLESLAHAGSRSVTYAPEHGSERIRDLLNKPYSYDEILERIVWAFDSGMLRVKLYFLTGFDEETDEDISGTIEMVESLVTDCALLNRPPDNRITIGLAPFVPKASTPFQRRPMQDERVLKRKIKSVTDALRDIPKVDLETESPRMSIIQGTISVGDRSIGHYLERISMGRDSLAGAWDEALAELGDAPRANVLRSRDGSGLPWGFIRRPKSGEMK